MNVSTAIERYSRQEVTETEHLNTGRIREAYIYAKLNALSEIDSGETKLADFVQDCESLSDRSYEIMLSKGQSPELWLRDLIESARACDNNQ